MELDEKYYSNTIKIDDIYGKRNHDVTNVVFNLVYSGFHGNISATGYGQDIPRMSPNPIEIIQKKRKYIVENINLYKNNVFLKASGESYKTLRFWFLRSRIWLKKESLLTLGLRHNGKIF